MSKEVSVFIFDDDLKFWRKLFYVIFEFVKDLIIFFICKFNDFYFCWEYLKFRYELKIWLCSMMFFRNEEGRICEYGRVFDGCEEYCRLVGRNRCWYF